jgi:hypothetical protein
MPHSRVRRIAAASLIGVLAAGLTVHGLLPDTAATDIAGDALYTAAVYCAVVLAFGATPLTAALVAGGWSVAIELFQATRLPLEIAAAFPPAALVLGTAFDPRDLVVYVAAAAVAGGADAALTRRRQRRADTPA